MNQSFGSSEISKFSWESWKKPRRRKTGRRWTDWNKTSPSTAWITLWGKDIQLLSVGLVVLYLAQVLTFTSFQTPFETWRIVFVCAFYIQPSQSRSRHRWRWPRSVEDLSQSSCITSLRPKLWEKFSAASKVITFKLKLRWDRLYHRVAWGLNKHLYF